MQYSFPLVPTQERGNEVNVLLMALEVLQSLLLFQMLITCRDAPDEFTEFTRAIGQLVL